MENKIVNKLPLPLKPKKNLPPKQNQFMFTRSSLTLGCGGDNLKMALKLPYGVDLDEWIAINTLDLFNEIYMMFGTIKEYCTEKTCPIMSAGPKFEYRWANGRSIKTPIQCSAPQYIDYLMSWVEEQIDDETLFPSVVGVPFPENFMNLAKTICRRLFRVYAHIYHQHFHDIMKLGEEAHLNTSLKHFVYFVREFDLVKQRELSPLHDLIEKLIGKY